ncbi:hypothetical protein NSS79_23310 [Paenibacillus sp. FSL L8-0436]|uniref:hypothetical protein n=1 Tax=Paenibacillus sp. FSL L8-0436 TaxID=2954686 RepID=UPI0031590C84
MGFLTGILHFFVPRERTLLFTTFDQAQYFRVKSRLTAAGIRHRSKINGGMRAATNRANYGGNLAVQHELFVSKKDEHRALKEIQSSSV